MKDTITITFTGNETANELYRLTIRNVLDLVKVAAAGATDKQLRELYIQLSELRAIVDAEEARRGGY